MIIYLNCEDNGTTFNKKNYLLRAAERINVGSMFQDIGSDKSIVPDFVLNIVPYARFVPGKQWTAVWELDQICDRQQAGENWTGCDTVFLTAVSLPDRLKNHCGDKHRLLFQACDPVLHSRFKEPEYDFVQCGTAGDGIYSERSRLIKLLREKYSFHDFGKHYRPEDYVKNISKARVQFIRSTHNTFGVGEIAQRFFECLAIGPVLTNWCEDLAHTGLIEGEEYFSYKNDEEMFEKMDKLIKDPVFAADMARKGRNKAILYHSYENRLGAIFNAMKEDRR